MQNLLMFYKLKKQCRTRNGDGTALYYMLQLLCYAACFDLINP